MKRILSVLVIMALILTYMTTTEYRSESNVVYGADSSSQLHYHLDMGVYVVSKVGGKWANNVSYGSVQPYTANLTFGDDIKIKRIMTLDQAKQEGIDIWNQKNFTNNVPQGIYETSQDAYNFIYYNWISPSISDIKIISNKDNNVKYSYNALLQSRMSSGFDLIQIYKAKSDSISTVEKIVVKNNSLVQTIKSLETEKEELWIIVKSIGTSGAEDEQLSAYKRYQTVCKQLNALYAKPTETTKENVIQSYKLDVKDYIDTVFQFWGTPQALNKLNPSMYQLLVNMSAAKDVDFNNQYYLVFLPTVIEYEVETPPPAPTPPAILIPDTTGDCKKVIQWSEVQSHTYTVGSGISAKTYTCFHRYYYEATLNSTATLTADKPNGGSTTFKSGYGFKVTANNTISVKQINDNGECSSHKSKANSKAPLPPTTAEVRTDWKVFNKEKKVTQGTTVALKKSSGGSNTANFATAANPVSNYNKALIYTDVALKGTNKKPVKHTITVYVYGGGVNGVAFCNSIPLSFTINGNMYEDDATVDSN